MTISEDEMVTVLEAELNRFISEGWDIGMAQSPFDAGEWLLAFEELYWAAVNPDHPGGANENFKLLQDYFEHHGVDFSDIGKEFR